jgi:hypothetical protein
LNVSFIDLFNILGPANIKLIPIKTTKARSEKI